ncbi:MAG: TetR/AcrR family transcriptional regulator [Actinomycetes bacterium]
MPVTETTPKATRLPRHKRRAQLLDVALEVFVSQGYHAAAMDDIADRAGVSKPVLYQHFPSKLELYVALLDSSAEELKTRLKEALASTRENRKRVSAAVAAYFAFVDDSTEAFRLLFESDLFNEEAVRVRVELNDRECTTLLVEVIAEDTGLDREESTTLAYGLIGMAKTSARYWLRSNKPVSREDAVLLVSRMAWRGISGFPRSPQTADADDAGGAAGIVLADDQARHTSST